MSKAELVQVIKTDLLIRGDGKTDPIRRVSQYWDGKGGLLAELDTVKDQHYKDLCIDIAALNDYINKEIPEVSKDISKDLSHLRRISSVLAVFKDMVDRVNKTHEEKESAPQEEVEEIPEVTKEEWDGSESEPVKDPQEA